MLKEAREKGRLSATDVAKKIQVSERTYRSYERGETYPPFDKALRLFDVLGIPYSIGEHAQPAQDVIGGASFNITQRLNGQAWIEASCTIIRVGNIVIDSNLSSELVYDPQSVTEGNSNS